VQPQPTTLQLAPVIDNTGFPFVSNLPYTYAQARAQLPSQGDIKHWIECYYRHSAWNSTPVLQDDLLEMLHNLPDRPSKDRLDTVFQQLALIFIVIALGSALNMEMPANDPTAKEYCAMAQQCLVSGHFLINNTLLAVQALVSSGDWAMLTGKVPDGEVFRVGLLLRDDCPDTCSDSDLPGRRDMAWQIRGIASRIMIAVSRGSRHPSHAAQMGLHRDGARWHLSTKAMNERRCDLVEISGVAHSDPGGCSGRCTAQTSSW
jgi:hypothetical protein